MLRLETRSALPARFGQDRRLTDERGGEARATHNAETAVDGRQDVGTGGDEAGVEEELVGRSKVGVVSVQRRENS